MRLSAAAAEGDARLCADRRRGAVSLWARGIRIARVSAGPRALRRGHAREGASACGSRRDAGLKDLSAVDAVGPVDTAERRRDDVACPLRRARRRRLRAGCTAPRGPLLDPARAERRLIAQSICVCAADRDVLAGGDRRRGDRRWRRPVAGAPRGAAAPACDGARGLTGPPAIRRSRAGAGRFPGCVQIEHSQAVRFRVRRERFASGIRRRGRRAASACARLSVLLTGARAWRSRRGRRSRCWWGSGRGRAASRRASAAPRDRGRRCRRCRGCPWR